MPILYDYMYEELAIQRGQMNLAQYTERMKQQYPTTDLLGLGSEIEYLGDTHRIVGYSLLEHEYTIRNVSDNNLNRIRFKSDFVVLVKKENLAFTLVTYDRRKMFIIGEVLRSGNGSGRFNSTDINYTLDNVDTRCTASGYEFTLCNDDTRKINRTVLIEETLGVTVEKSSVGMKTYGGSSFGVMAMTSLSELVLKLDKVITLVDSKVFTEAEALEAVGLVKDTDAKQLLADITVEVEWRRGAARRQKISKLKAEAEELQSREEKQKKVLAELAALEAEDKK